MTISVKLPRWLARPLMVAGGLALVGVCGWYGPVITASLWHVCHPRGWVEYRGLRVRVPWPWVADTEAEDADPTMTPQGLQLKRMPREMLHRGAPQSIFVTVISPDRGLTPEQQRARWLEMFRASHPGAEFDPETVGGASCSSAKRGSSPSDVVWTCISVQGGWIANFEGHDRSVPVFLHIVASLKPRP